MRRRPALLAAAPPLLAALVLVVAALPADPPDELRAAAAAALLVALGSFGLRLAGRLLGGAEAGAATLLTAAGVFGTAGAVLAATALGAAGHLRPAPFLLAAAGLGVLATLLPPVRLLARREGGPAAPDDPPVPSSGASSPIPPAHASSPTPLSGGPSPSPPPDSPWRFLRRLVRPADLARLELALVLSALASVAVLVGAETWSERWVPPRKLDDASYHLSTVALWTHTHDLRTIKFDDGDRSTAFYPIGGELVAWALVAPLRDGDWATRWNQLLYGLLSIAAVVAVARRLGVSRRGSLLAVLLWVSTRRAFPLLLFTAGNDHSTGFYLVALVDAALLAAARPKAGPALYAGAALGLLVGTKYLGLMLGGPVVLLAAALVLARARRDPPGTWRRRLAQAGWAGAAAAALGGYTYLRNLAALGNPVFPAPVELFGVELPGWRAVTIEVRRHLPEFAIDPVGFLLRRDVFGEVFRLVTLPAALVAPVAGAVARGTAAERLARAGTFALPAIAYVLFLRLVHDHRENRYLFGAIAVAAVAAAWLVDRWARRGGSGAVVAALVGAGAGAAVLHRSIHWLERTAVVEAAVVGLLAGLGWLAAGPWARRAWRAGPAAWLRRPAVPPAAAALALTAAALAGGLALDAYRERQLRHEPIADWLDRTTRGRGAVVAYVGHNAPYPFTGTRLQNRIEIVPTNWNLDGRHFDWGRRARFPFDGGRYPLWLENLERLGVEWIVVERQGRVRPERDWMRWHPGRFRRVWGIGSRELWRLERRPAPDPPSR